MVPVRRVADQFEAQVLVARLGSVGIVAQLRGSGVDTVYPMGTIEVLVPEDELADAQELLLADEVESSFDDGGDAPSRSAGWRALTGVLVVVMLVFVVIARMLGG